MITHVSERCAGRERMQISPASYQSSALAWMQLRLGEVQKEGMEFVLGLDGNPAIIVVFCLMVGVLRVNPPVDCAS